MKKNDYLNDPHSESQSQGSNSDKSGQIDVPDLADEAILIREMENYIKRFLPKWQPAAYVLAEMPKHMPMIQKSGFQEISKDDYFKDKAVALINEALGEQYISFEICRVLDWSIINNDPITNLEEYIYENIIKNRMITVIRRYMIEKYYGNSKNEAKELLSVIRANRDYKNICTDLNTWAKSEKGKVYASSEIGWIADVSAAKQLNIRRKVLGTTSPFSTEYGEWMFNLQL